MDRASFVAFEEFKKKVEAMEKMYVRAVSQK
jgi:hypothetical protein